MVTLYMIDDSVITVRTENLDTATIALRVPGDFVYVQDTRGVEILINKNHIIKVQ